MNSQSDGIVMVVELNTILLIILITIAWNNISKQLDRIEKGKQDEETKED
jgi:hypothetical protein